MDVFLGKGGMNKVKHRDERFVIASGVVCDDADFRTVFQTFVDGPSEFLEARFGADVILTKARHVQTLCQNVFVFSRDHSFDAIDNPIEVEHDATCPFGF